MNEFKEGSGTKKSAEATESSCSITSILLGLPLVSGGVVGVDPVSSLLLGLPVEGLSTTLLEMSSTPFSFIILEFDSSLIPSFMFTNAAFISESMVVCSRVAVLMGSGLEAGALQ